jgi:hypothetical protein
MAEQAKAVDAMAAIPELKTLHEQFVKLQAERVTAPFEAEVAKLNAGYVGGIDREIANEKKAGHLDGVIALEAEKKLIQGVGTSLSPQTRDQDGPAPSPIPAEDDAATTEVLKKLRGIYRTAYAKIEAARAENLKTLTAPLDNRLKQLEATLTQQDRIAHAKTVRDYRDGLGKAAGPPAAASDPGAANTPSTALGGPSALPKKKFPPGDDRKAAEWALDLGGSISIRDGRDTKTISKKDDLPKSSFEVLSIRLRTDSAVKPPAPFTGLAPMAGLRSLEHFDANGIHVTDDDTPVLASLPNLRGLTIGFTKQFTGSALSLLKDSANLQAVNFGSCGLRKQGLEQLGQLDGLISATISSNELTDDDVAPLRNLKKLTKLHLGRNPLSLEAWRQLKGLPLTSIQYTPEPGRAKEWTKELASLFPAITQSMMVIQEGAVPTVADIEALAAFPLLKELGVTSSATDDQVLEAISHLSNLQNVELSTGLAPNPLPITDEGIAHLLNLKSLNRLVLRRSQNLSPAALTTLARLKSFKTLELAECPQLDDAAIAAFKKERPDVTVKR